MENALELLAVTQDMTCVMSLYEAHAGNLMQTIKVLSSFCANCEIVLLGSKGTIEKHSASWKIER